jgi:hypothetical protein
MDRRKSTATFLYNSSLLTLRSIFSVFLDDLSSDSSFVGPVLHH